MDQKELSATAFELLQSISCNNSPVPTPLKRVIYKICQGIQEETQSKNENHNSADSFCMNAFLHIEKCDFFQGFCRELQISPLEFSETILHHLQQLPQPSLIILMDTLYTTISFEDSPLTSEKTEDNPKQLGLIGGLFKQ